MEDNKVMDVLNEIKTLVDESNGTMEDLGKQLSEAVQNADLEAAKKLLEEKITPVKELNAKLGAWIGQLEEMEKGAK